MLDIDHIFEKVNDETDLGEIIFIWLCRHRQMELEKPRRSRCSMKPRHTSVRNWRTSQLIKGRIPHRGGISCDHKQDKIGEGASDEVKVKRIGLMKCIDTLNDKRVSTREKALMAIIDAFEKKMNLQEVNENSFFTLQDKFVNLIKKGSIIEACRAARCLGLLVITLGYGDNAHEIMKMSIPQLSEAFKAGPELLKISVLDCLALITLVGANDCEEIQTTMQIMWHVITESSASKATGNRHTPVVLAKAISVWSFLLTAIDEWKISLSWKKSFEYFSSLLCHEDLCVCSATGEAIAVIFESGCPERFFEELYSFRDYSSIESNYFEEGLKYLETLKGKILNQVQDLFLEADIRDLYDDDLNNETNVFEDLLTFLKTGCCPEFSLKIKKEQVLKVSTWPQLTKNFLGHGFLMHMQENKMLHDLFELTPEGDQHPSKDKDDEEPMLNPAKVHSKKARTQFMNRKRMVTQNRKQGHFLVTEED